MDCKVHPGQQVHCYWKQRGSYKCELKFSLFDSLYAAHLNTSPQVWEIGRKRIRSTFRLSQSVRALDISPDGRFLVSASYNHSVCIWNIRDGSKRTLYMDGPRRILWHGNPNSLSVAFSPDGQYVAAGNEVGFLNIWDVRTGRLVAKWKIRNRFTAPIMSVVFTPDGKGIVSGIKTLRCWDISSLTRNHFQRDNTLDHMNQIWGFIGHTVRSSFHLQIQSRSFTYLFYGKETNH